MNILGSVSLWGFGVVIGAIGVMVLVYWILDEWREAEGATEVIEGVGERSGSAMVVIIGVLLTIGDQLIQLVADLFGMIGAPVIVGHLVGGFLGWLGLRGTISEEQFIVFFGIVTILALIWRASVTRGRGL